MNTQRSQKRGFSLTELLIVMAIIGILAGIVYVSFSGSSGKGRDAKRQADLKTLQNAIEQYKTKYGQYPAQGTGSGCGTNAVSLSIETSCPNYVDDLVPEFLPRLPTDSRATSGQGFAYITNSTGSVYKAMVIGTVESETVTYEHQMSSCDMSTITNPEDSNQSNVMCGEVLFNGNSTPTQCRENNSRFRTSYGVWGGYAEKTTNSTSFKATGSMLDLTQKVVCR